MGDFYVLLSLIICSLALWHDNFEFLTWSFYITGWIKYMALKSKKTLYIYLINYEKELQMLQHFIKVSFCGWIWICFKHCTADRAEYLISMYWSSLHKLRIHLVENLKKTDLPLYDYSSTMFFLSLMWIL